MRQAILAAALAMGCNGETGFQSLPDDNQIVGSGTLQLSQERLDFVDLEIGKARSLVILAENVGDFELKIDYGRVVADETDSFYTDEDANDSLRLRPAGTREIIIVCELSEEQFVEGTFRISSNDSERPVIDIPMTGTPLNWTGDSGT